ncbi:MAG: hypothetical protein JWM08_532 [Candidatus Angelobacter sp.]|nr:hypothetical protein [Candidatus Angelobacter sp.]
MPCDNYRVANAEPVFPSKMRTEVVFRNASVMMAFMLFVARKMRVMFAMVVTVFPAFMAAVVMFRIIAIMFLQCRGAYRKCQQNRQSKSNQLHQLISPSQ